MLCFSSETITEVICENPDHSIFIGLIFNVAFMFIEMGLFLLLFPRISK